MNFTDIFIKRPVLATVVSLLILLVGLRSLQLLGVSEFPETENAIVTVQTAYPGASAELVEGFITTPLETEIATADGIDYLESASLQGISSITAYLDVNYDPLDAVADINTKVNAVRNEMPEEAEDSTIEVEVGQTTASMYLGFYSDSLAPNEITDYLIRVVQPELSTVSGVQRAEILGEKRFAMRVWLKPDRMAALNVTPADVSRVLAANNFLAGVGKTKGAAVSVNLTASTDLHSVEEFKDLIVKRQNGATIRLKDIADVRLGAEDYETSVKFSGQDAVYIGIEVVPGANVLSTIAQVRDMFERLKSELPTGLNARIAYDATDYINQSIDEVLHTLGEAGLIVIAVIFLFLGSVRHSIIPAVTVPLSLVGGAFLMLALGFSINLLTLLAMVLAIGMVVDDAIIVVENIDRHIAEGMQPMEAALRGARELGGPVIAMTITLLAVYAPIGFLGGLTGALFTEFAFTLAGAVLISGIIALTLSPMMCARLLKPHTGNGGFTGFLDRQFGHLKDTYQGVLHRSLNYLPVTAAFACLILVSCYFLYTSSLTELAPEEDQGVLFMESETSPNASLDHLAKYTDEVTRHVLSFPETKFHFLFNGVGGGGAAATTSTAISGMVFKPWEDRDRTQQQIQPLLQAKVDGVTALQTAVFTRPPLPGARGLPVEFVVGSTEPPSAIYPVSQELLKRAQASGLFAFVDSDLDYDKAETAIRIDRNRAADLGLDMREVGSDIAAMLGGNYINRFSIEGRAYEVTPQVRRQFRLNPEQLLQYRVRAPNGQMIPLSTFASLEKRVEPRQLNRFQQLNAATIEGVPMPGVPLGEALGYLQSEARKIFPQGYKADYAGQARQFVQESGGLVLTFFFAIVIIYLVLAAQFESFRDPLIMLISVPMSICGALIFLSLGFATINIYTQVGLVTLIGVISKHGILIVQFANQLQEEEGMGKREAIEAAAAIRLRPVLMTTAALVVAMIPLLTATGAGAASRFSIGLVIATGMSIGTLFTLFVVPAVYLLIARDHTKDRGRAPAQATARPVEA
ncbi:MAG: efflux RND transporter permease subunit [Gammaproteobacteria bacterium]